MRAEWQRHLLVWGEEKMRALGSAHVVVAGVGGLGCVVAEQLARAGVGALTLIDSGTVAVSDLGRQVLYTHDDVGRKKTEAAAERLRRIAPQAHITPLDRTITDAEAFLHSASWHHGQLPMAYADCLDNFASRFALERQIPAGAFLVHAGIEGERGQLTTVMGGGSPCLRDIFAGAQTPPSPIPVIPQCCAVVGGLQSLAVINNIWHQAGLLAAHNLHATYRGRLGFLDLTDGRIDSVRLSG